MPFLTGLGTGLSLIIAIGAQNAFVLRQGIRREHLLAVVLVCALSDALLISLGVSGVGLALQAVPMLVVVVRWVGVAFLVSYAVLALRRAWRPSGDALSAEDAGTADGGAARTTTTRVRSTTLTATVLTTLAITWLNPHVYLDTVFLLGSIAQAQPNRLLFALGAISGSFLWFFALAYGARHLGRWLSSPRSWRILDVVIAVIMLAIAASLALGH
ncbi:LysE/ArgO family amino acid transporter [Microbacterium gorillae]|uniref:LysE/ArgO family amino acid transporter n=1 Tax=Microbacterium gorillae TaxID=1231063 RepID=UPI00058CD421|nr:LysE/ArgO family amino acid transporter [Microbacterium gorillae]